MKRADKWALQFWTDFATVVATEICDGLVHKGERGFNIQIRLDEILPSYGVHILGRIEHGSSVV